MRSVRIFVSSPGDTHFERMRVERVVERLNGELSGIARLEAIRWEGKFYQVRATFQKQIPAAAECDLVVAILRHRLGNELPDDFPAMPNGERYLSGTAYEILSAISLAGRSDAAGRRCGRSARFARRVPVRIRRGSRRREQGTLAGAAQGGLELLTGLDAAGKLTDDQKGWSESFNTLRNAGGQPTGQ